MQFDVTLSCGCDVTVECEMNREWRGWRYHGVVTSVEGFVLGPDAMLLEDRCPGCAAEVDPDVLRDLCQQEFEREEEARP